VIGHCTIRQQVFDCKICFNVLHYVFILFSFNVYCHGHRVEQVRQFVYLGSVITEDCKCHEEVKRGIAIGKEAFSKRGELLRGKMKLDLKTRIVKTLIWSTILYAAETWTLRKVDIQRLESFEMWIWRRLMKISWTEHQSIKRFWTWRMKTEA